MIDCQEEIGYGCGAMHIQTLLIVLSSMKLISTICKLRFVIFLHHQTLICQDSMFRSENQNFQFRISAIVTYTIMK